MMKVITSGQKLKHFLACNDSAIASGVCEDRVDTFETDYGVFLPQDFKSYLLEVNGSRDDYVMGLVRFWSIDEVKSVAREVANTPPNSAAIQSSYRQRFDGDDAYYVFADLQHEVQLYAIKLSSSPREQNDVVLLDGTPPLVVAGSFSEFVEMYLECSAKLRMAWD